MAVYFHSFVFVLLLSIKFGCCLKCHVCSSKTTQSCLDPFNSNGTSMLKECLGKIEDFPDLINIVMQKLGPDFQGAKERNKVINSLEQNIHDLVCQKIVIVVNGESTTSRGCSPQFLNGVRICDAISLSATDLQVRHCTACRYDACNSATNLTSMLYIKMLVILVLSLFHFC